MESEGGGISRRQKSTKGVYRKITTDYQWGDHKNITVPYGEIK